MQDFAAFTKLIAAEATRPVMVNLDWLSVLFFDYKNSVPEADHDEANHQASDRITLRYFGKGTEHYRFIWHVLYQGEHWATMLSHTRNEKFVKKGIVKVDFKNHLLYTSSLWPFYYELQQLFGFGFKNISRVDIAVDGLNYMLKFLNQYVKQTPAQKSVEMKGRNNMIKAGLLDKRTMLHQHFKIGNPNSQKMVVMYNKSLDIVRTGKTYIQDVWKANGVCRELLPSTLFEEFTETNKRNARQKAETYYLEGYENIYRFEMRISGGLIKAMPGFSLDFLQTPDKMMSLLKRHNKGFFEFVKYTRTDVSKCEPIEVLPYSRFNIQAIDVARSKPIDDRYKSKLNIKKSVRQLYLKNLLPDDYATRETMMFDIQNFELHDFFIKRIGEWKREFSKVQPDEQYCAELAQFLTQFESDVLADKPDEETILQRADPADQPAAPSTPTAAQGTRATKAAKPASTQPRKTKGLSQTDSEFINQLLKGAIELGNQDNDQQINFDFDFDNEKNPY